MSPALDGLSGTLDMFDYPNWSQDSPDRALIELGAGQAPLQLSYRDAHSLSEPCRVSGTSTMISSSIIMKRGS